MNNFELELENLINKYNKEIESNTPDFILASYLLMCLEAYNLTLQKREAWYGKPIETIKLEPTKISSDLPDVETET